MNNYFIILLYSAGIIQTLVLAAVILRKKKSGSKSNQILLALLLTILFVLIQYTLMISESGFRNRFMGELTTICWFGLAPLFYLYVLSQKANFKIQRWYSVLFIIPVYNLLQYGVSLFYPGLGFYLLFDNVIIYSYAWLMAYLLHTILFVTLSIISLKRNDMTATRSLLKFFFIWLAILIVASGYLFIKANSLVYFYQIERYLVVVFDVFVLMLTFRSLLTSRSFDAQEEALKYSNSALSENELAQLHEKLVAVMDREKPYMNRKLNLTELSRVTTIRENQLSQVFSQYLNSSFYDFVSQYRLSEVEQRLQDPKFAHLKIISLAEDCGFNSKAAFYKIFKEKHAKTPTQYLKSIQ